MFSDAEHRILLSAIRRERRVCEDMHMNHVHEPYEVNLIDVCNSIERKVHDIQHKYRWHDLRKNPDDLPPIAEVVIAWFERGDVCAVVRYHDGYAYNEAYALREMQIEHQSEIVAWKFPELFEEVE